MGKLRGIIFACVRLGHAFPAAAPLSAFSAAYDKLTFQALQGLSQELSPALDATIT